MIQVLPGLERGKYPYGNSVLVQGSNETVLIDPSLSFLEVNDLPITPERVDRVLISHSHEDHLAGLFRFPHAPVHVHAADRIGLESLDGLMRIYGMSPALEAPWRSEVRDRFHYVPRPDAISFDDDDVFDVGGTRIRVVHLPGHTRGHSGFLIEPDGVMFLADVDLTGFGPYYGDAWSSIDDFERTLERCREIEAGTFITFHHKGTVTSRSEFLALLRDYGAVIGRRDDEMLEYLREPRTIDDMAARRFIYRPHVELLFVESVERRSAVLHLERLTSRGLVRQLDARHYVRS
jgi:glyoxylase-like metal-dependent hydrolase (beta-lactamase superfamily II)